MAHAHSLAPCAQVTVSPSPSPPPPALPSPPSPPERRRRGMAVTESDDDSECSSARATRIENFLLTNKQRWERADFKKLLGDASNETYIGPLASTCTAAAPSCRSRLSEIAALPAPSSNPFRDYDWCLKRAACPAPIGADCVARECAALVQKCESAGSATSLPIGIVTVDSRVHSDHPGVQRWTMYASVHNYTYISKWPEVPPDANYCANRIMLQDWSSSLIMLDIIRDPQYAHVAYFMYVELDQWMVRSSTIFRPSAPRPMPSSALSSRGSVHLPGTPDGAARAPV